MSEILVSKERSVSYVVSESATKNLAQNGGILAVEDAEAVQYTYFSLWLSFCDNVTVFIQALAGDAILPRLSPVDLKEQSVQIWCPVSKLICTEQGALTFTCLCRFGPMALPPKKNYYSTTNFLVASL